jgi:ATP-dependent helicase/nuclease subunit B
MTAVPKVFNIPASARFLPELIAALRGGRLIEGFPASRDPLELARATLYLPTRRACRMARDAFLTALEGHAAILPRIVALGDLDEDEIIFADAATAELAEDTLALPPAIKPLDRRLLLAQLIVRWAAAIRPEQGAPLIANTPAAALALADDLARLIDDVITRKVDWQRLDSLVPDQFDTYWQYTLDFLKIARSYWPKLLAARRSIGRRACVPHRAEMRRLAGRNRPVIAAGSTGSRCRQPQSCLRPSRSFRRARSYCRGSTWDSTRSPGAGSRAARMRKARRPPCTRNSPCRPCLCVSACHAMP